ncbi:MAG: 16S rRNA (guanine(966)-N(2))-methyltransferase RsmD [Sediminimonas qiaohouensis]|uniref:16S rRNA (Guanine(966)-N(2))-methyltransferase RsmD n=1 Tax=Sediminimonas qiaohouensis TaxID=552061 RepID=A0A7C9LLR7_9RHOB|nr:16S rRNA (guanine(966)-N(2))-methyltransferase RsmD [Sediminimonas qiaohouensis]MTJ04999.1 16S rRNA (guanine(966)-N(2))-methyltransferase RsmD [Sediminimonas qiaohouensis]
MRIIAGKWRSRALASVGKGDAGAHLRPTTDRTRESLFSMLAGGRFDDPITGARVLDLFAGTGALGLEALSRGAAQATFVEDGRKALSLLRQNVEICGAQEHCTVLRRDARRLGANEGTAHDLVFLDPPYGKGLGEKAMAAALNGGWIAPGALVVWEESAEIVPPEGLLPLDSRRYGDTQITLLRAR